MKLLTVAEALVVFSAEYAGVHNVTIFDYLLVSNVFMLIMVLGIRCFAKRRGMELVFWLCVSALMLLGLDL